MKKIQLTRNKYTIVDDDMFDYLNQYKWHLSDNGYAVRRPWGPNGSYTIRMHRIVSATPDGLVTDHINGNPLDNRKSNLKNCTQQENMCNMKLRSDSSTKEKNVGWHSQSGKYRVRFTRNKEMLCCKLFKDIKDAIKFRDEFRKSL